VGGTLVAAVLGSGASYTVSVTGMTTDGMVIATIAAGVAEDEFGNSNTASTTFDNTVNWIFTVPTVTINQGATQVDPTSTSPITFDVDFSDEVTGFDGSDVDFTGSTAGGTLVASVSGSFSSYTVSVSGMTTGGTVVASIPAGAAQDASNDGNTQSTSTDNGDVGQRGPECDHQPGRDSGRSHDHVAHHVRRRLQRGCDRVRWLRCRLHR
jgi:hypothetical protein